MIKVIRYTAEYLCMISDYGSPERHRHPTAHLVYAAEGTLRATVGTAQNVCKGLMIRSGTEHEIQADGQMMVRPIESFFDIKDGQIRSGQQFSRLINCTWFRRKPLYPKVNSYELIGMHPTEPPPNDRWDGLSPDQLALMKQLNGA